MSFLAKYWNVVERAVSEKGMNPGDVHVNLSELFNNTEVTNTVLPELETEPEVTNEPKPAEAGNMPDPVIAELQETIRGLARPGEEFEEYAEPPTRGKARKSRSGKRKASSSDDGESMGNRTKREKVPGYKTKKVEPALRKQLKKIGGGRKVNLILEKVVCDDETIWSAPDGDRR